MGTNLESDTDVMKRNPACVERKRKRDAVNAERFIVGVLSDGECDRRTDSVEESAKLIGRQQERRASA